VVVVESVLLVDVVLAAVVVPGFVTGGATEAVVGFCTVPRTTVVVVPLSEPRCVARYATRIPVATNPIAPSARSMPAPMRRSSGG
jgi:hypothetical protein